MLSYALSTGTQLATSYFHLPFDDEEDRDIENYERRHITWEPETAAASSSSTTTTDSLPNRTKTSRGSTSSSPFSSGPSSPSSSRASSLSACSSSASLSSMTSTGTSVSGASTSTNHTRWASEPSSPTASCSSIPKPSFPSSSQRHSRSPSSPSTSSHSHSTTPVSKGKNKAPTSSSSQNDDGLIQEILRDSDLYSILGVPSNGVLDKMTLRRAYLARSRGCHPDKFPSNPHATQAFQKVSVAYNVLSTPHLRRRYDEHRASRASGPSSSSSSSGDNANAEFDVFASGRPSGFAEDTLRSVILGVFNDFLDNGDLEVIRNMLKALNEMNPGVTIGDEGIKSVLSTLHAIRERALTCRTCIYTLHNELTRLLEVQHNFSQLSYFDILGRTRTAVQLTRIAIGLPIALEKALLMERESKERLKGGASWESDREQQYSDNDGRTRRKQGSSSGSDGEPATTPTTATAGGAAVVQGVFPRHVMLLVRGVDAALETMERIVTPGM